MKLHLESVVLEVIEDEDAPKPENADFAYGIRYKATLRISLDTIPNGFVERFSITSMGVWGIDDVEYGKTEYGPEELDQITEMLAALGIHSLDTELDK